MNGLTGSAHTRASRSIRRNRALAIASKRCAGARSKLGMSLSELRESGTEIWIAEGPLVSLFGLPYPTRIAAVRFVVTPDQLDDSLLSQRSAVAALLANTAREARP